MNEDSGRTIIFLLKRRREEGYESRSHADGHHIALVIEGGGMRGVAAGGMVSALEDLGLRNCFDSVHGSSAGAAAGAYFVAEQANQGTRIFYEDLNGSEFISKFRFLCRRPVMDTHFLVDHVMKVNKPINFGKILEAAPDLYTICTDIDKNSSVSFDNFRDVGFFRECLNATITMPLIAGGPKVVNGRRLFDGGLIQQIAIQSAFSAGATHVLALQTRRRDEQYRPERTRSIFLQSVALQAFYGGHIGEIYRKRNMRINESIRTIELGRGPDE